ncbi:MAG: ATP-binding cassette domain-containing protein, partial [Flavobacteriaceae bacterium]
NGVKTTQIVTLLGVFVAAAFRMIPSINRILSALQNIKYYGATVNKIYDQIIGFDFSKSNKNSKEFAFDKEIKLEDIQFSYKEKIILNSINLKIKKGTTIGIVGASGSGKSTLVDLINGLLKPTKGTITVDGIQIDEFIKSWQQTIGYVGQEIFLIDDTIKANIAFGMSDQEINMDSVYKALEAAQLSSFIDELELGIETKVGERGIQLSGGQKQRIGIARALYQNPSVLIFDEATASLDNETEKHVMNSIYNLKQDKTMIIIAHRISTLQDCDQVYEIKNGKIKLKELEWAKTS